LQKMFKLLKNPLFIGTEIGMGGGRCNFFGKGLGGGKAPMQTPGERLAEIIRGAAQYTENVKRKKCDATYENVVKMLEENNVPIFRNYKVSCGEGCGDNHIFEDHEPKIKKIINKIENEVEFEGHVLKREGEVITLIRPRNTLMWLNACAEAISKDFGICGSPETLAKFGNMLLQNIKQDDASRHKNPNTPDSYLDRARFYTMWTLTIHCGCEPIHNNHNLSKTIAAATVDELFRLLDEAEKKLKPETAFLVFEEARLGHGGFLGERLAPKIVALYDKIVKDEKMTGQNLSADFVRRGIIEIPLQEQKAKKYMNQLRNNAYTPENDAFAMRAIDAIATDFEKLIADGKPQEALSLLMRVCYKHVTGGYNEYSIGTQSGNPKARLKEMNKTAVEKAKELKVELKVSSYYTYENTETEVRW